MKGLLVFFSFALHPYGFARAKWYGQPKEGGGLMRLPEPVRKHTFPLERAIQGRRTVRSFKPLFLTLDQLSQLLWAAQGITDVGGYKRAAPSAGALYPMDVYAVVGNNGVDGLNAGIYLYDPAIHGMKEVSTGDRRQAVAVAGLSQMWLAGAPVSFVITAEYSRVAVKYGRRGVRYAMIEAGHIGQNLFLQAEALGLAAGIVGAFDDDNLIQVMKIPDTHEPLLIMPVGYKR
jgi:SagB-type dehydrogenase family enzyme